MTSPVFFSVFLKLSIQYAKTSSSVRKDFPAPLRGYRKATDCQYVRCCMLRYLSKSWRQASLSNICM